ncbi:hypothetical protein FRC06_009854 [Ceratobasidium sp. 370]|nr:hypothetical protein FRC06_009854 [Ceratobasidium sp. 370]
MLLKQVAEVAEEVDTGPVELEGGSAPTLLQSTGHMVLGSRHQPPASRTTNNISCPEGPDTPLDGAPDPFPQEPCLEAQPAYDTATELESESEVIELGPGDSVSQQPLRARQTPHPPPIAAQPPHPTNTNLSDNSDTATIPESDEEAPQPAHNSGTSRAHKQQQLAHRSQSPEFHISHPISSASRNRLTHSARSSIHLPPLIPPSAPRANPDLSISKLPPTSDPNAMLAWAAQLANQALVLRAAAHHVVSTSRQGSQADQSKGPLSLLAKVLGEAHSHLVASAPALPTESRHYSLYPRHTDLIEDNAETLEAEAAIALG